MDLNRLCREPSPRAFLSRTLGRGKGKMATRSGGGGEKYAVWEKGMLKLFRPVRRGYISVETLEGETA